MKGAKNTPPLYNYVHLIAFANVCKGYELRTFAEKPTTSGGKHCPDNKATVPRAPLASPMVGEVAERSEAGEVRTQAPHVRTLQPQFSPLGQTAGELAKVNERSMTRPLNRAAVKAPQTHSSFKRHFVPTLRPTVGEPRRLFAHRGFTLMEVMVVIVVIAVIASVAGPMIGSITDQGRESATKAKLSALKSGLLAYYADLGKFPSSGGLRQRRDGFGYWEKTYLGPIANLNALCCREHWYNRNAPGAKSFFGKKYKKNWRGPYMEGDPEDFMYDAWGNVIRYVAQEGHKNIYLWFAGADEHFYGGDYADWPPPKEFQQGLNAVIKQEPIADFDDDAPMDDIIVSIGVKFRFTCSNSWCSYFGPLIDGAWRDERLGADGPPGW